MSFGMTDSVRVTDGNKAGTYYFQASITISNCEDQDYNLHHWGSFDNFNVTKKFESVRGHQRINEKGLTNSFLSGKLLKFSCKGILAFFAVRRNEDSTPCSMRHSDDCNLCGTGTTSHLFPIALKTKSE